MIIKQNILATLSIFSSLRKIMKTLYQAVNLEDC